MTTRGNSCREKNDKYHEIPITQHFAAAARGDAPRPVVQFRRRWRNPADAHGLRHLHRRLQNTGRDSRGDGLENGTELYTLTDGTNDAWARSVCVADGTVYVAGYEQQPDGVVAKLWENGTLKYTLGSGGGNSYAYAVTAVRGSVYTAGSDDDGGALTDNVSKDETQIYD